MMRVRVCLALPAAPMRARLAEKNRDRSAGGRPAVRVRRCGHSHASVQNACRHRLPELLSFRGPGFGPGLRFNPSGPSRLPGLDPVVKDLAGYSKLASHRQNAFTSLDTLDRLQFVSRRKLTLLALLLPQVILGMPVTEIIVSHLRGAVQRTQFGEPKSLGLTRQPAGRDQPPPFCRSVIRVNSEGRPSRSAKPGHSAVPLLTYSVMPSTS